MTTYYPQYYVLPTYSLPVYDWVTSVPTVYSPVTTLSPQVYTALCPYTGSIEPVAPVITCVPEVEYNQPEVEEIDQEDVQDVENYKYQSKDPIELFISLPKELFPAARTQAIDPNPIIDQFCQLPNINGSVNWILDLEFGLPKIPVTRSIAVYNVKDNNVFCKNTFKIHPGFETCSVNFKKAVLYYYKRIMYQWYKGYVIMNHDKSFENFQTWLVLPMNLFGMGWR